jgi:hypothetical protein
LGLANIPGIRFDLFIQLREPVRDEKAIQFFEWLFK